RAAIRETFRKWRTVQDCEIFPNLAGDKSAQVDFWVAGKKRTLRCTRFDTFRVNLRAIYLTLEALRLADERGSLRELAAAATAFLPPPNTGPIKRPWWEVLGVMPDADDEVLDAAYKTLSKKRHPDAGGTDAAMAELNIAFEEAKAR